MGTSKGFGSPVLTDQEKSAIAAKVPAGKDATDQQVSAAVAAYMAGHPVANGENGKSAELRLSGGYVQWRQTPGGTWSDLIQVSALAGSDGKSIELQKTATAIQWRQVGGTWADLVLLSALKGDTGPAGATLVGQVVIGQTAALAIALGIREITADLAGTVVGERYIAFARSYRLNGGASTPGRPPGYTILDAACNIAGKITVSINAPLLAIGSSYAITTDIVKVNAS